MNIPEDSRVQVKNISRNETYYIQLAKSYCYFCYFELFYVVYILTSPCSIIPTNNFSHYKYFHE